MAFGSVVICGAGVIGTSISYYLATNHNVKSTLIDPVGLCPAASGKAGGFLALDWNDGSPVGPLSRRSFELHEQLAQDLNLPSDCYRRLTCQAVAVDPNIIQSNKPSNKKLQGVEWADIGVVGSQTLGTTDTIAQTLPKTFVHALFDKSKELVASELQIGKVKDVLLSEEDSFGKQKVIGVMLEDGSTINADVVVVAMGCWSHSIKSLKIPQMYGQKYHSAILRPERVLDQAVFFQGLGDPEVYPRPDGDVYVTGFPDVPVVVDEEPGKVEVREESIDHLIAVAGKVSSELKNAQVVKEKCSSCHLPLTANGMPIIGPIRGIGGAFVATGHSCWGILNSPATGEAVADLIVNGRSERGVNIESFYPRW